MPVSPGACQGDSAAGAYRSQRKNTSRTSDPVCTGARCGYGVRWDMTMWFASWKESWGVVERSAGRFRLPGCLASPPTETRQMAPGRTTAAPHHTMIIMHHYDYFVKGFRTAWTNIFSPGSPPPPLFPCRPCPVRAAARCGDSRTRNLVGVFCRRSRTDKTAALLRRKQYDT